MGREDWGRNIVRRAAIVWLLVIIALPLALLATAGGDGSTTLEAARTYLLRNSLKNSLIAAAAAALAAVLIQTLLAKANAARSSDARVLAWCMPILLPAAVGVLLWRTFLAPAALWLLQPEIALVSMGVIAAWFSTPFLYIAHRSGLTWPWWSSALLAGYIAVADVTTPLLLTGGQPFHATNTLASWAYLQYAVNRDPLMGGLTTVVWLALLVPVLLLFLMATPWQSTSGPSGPGQPTPVKRGRLADLALVFWIWLPLWGSFAGGFVRGFTPPGWMTLATMALPLLASAGAIALIGGPAVWFGQREGEAAPRAKATQRGGAGYLALALLAWPLLFILTAFTPDLQPWLWVLTVLAIGLVAGAGLVRLRRITDRRAGGRYALFFVWLVVWHGFPAETLLPGYGRMLAPGFVVAQMGAPTRGLSLTLLAGAFIVMLFGLLSWDVVRRMGKGASQDSAA
jgi:ABC-type sugar transport system permease subunit